MRNPKFAIKNRQQPILIATQSFFSPVLKTRQRGQKGSSHNQKKKKKNTLSFLCRSRTETDRQKEDTQKNMQGGELRASPAMSHFWDFQILGFSITGFASGKQQATEWLNLMAQFTSGSGFKSHNQRKLAPFPH
jgi:hypothetical protein